MIKLHAGSAVSEITPSQSVFLVGYPHVDRWSTGIHDPLLVSVLALRNDSTSILLAAVDLLFVNPSTARSWRQAISNQLGIPEQNVFISCSHTHSGPNTCEVLEWGPSPVVPPVESTYLKFVQQKIVETADLAMKSMRPSELAWTSTHIGGVGGNRHDPESGASDPEVGILIVRDRQTHDYISLSVIYGMHPTVLHEDSTLISSDFPHFTRLELKERLGSELKVLYHTGPAGDQSTRYDVKSQSFSEAERLGRKLGRAIHKTVVNLPDNIFSINPEMKASIVELTLPRRNIPSVTDSQKALDRYRKIYKDLQLSGAPHGPLRTAECDVFGAEETLYLAQCQENGQLNRVLSEYDPIDVQTIQIGDTVLAGFPGELFSEYGLMLKQQAPMRCFPVTLVNGDLQGYIVTEQAIREGRYETNNCVFAPAAGQHLVETALGELQRFQSTIQPQE
jgi:neutral ceramidase